MPSQNFRIPFPFGGFAKDRGYQISDPQTTRGANNVVPDDSGEARTRGGSRPGLTKRYPTNILSQPIYMVRVSVGEDSRVPEYLVVGTADNVWIGQSVPSGTSIPITYTEVLGPLSGALCAEDGQILTTEDDQEIVVADFDFTSVARCLVTAYKGKVILGPESVDPLYEGTQADATVTGALDETTLADSGGVDFTTLGIDLATHWVEFTDPSGDAASGTYRIKQVNATDLILERNAFGDGVAGGPRAVDYTIRVGVRQVDPVTGLVELLPPTAGYVPLDADAVVVYRDRLVWAVGRNWIMSRQGDPGDYDFGADPEDPARAITGTASEAGQPGDPLVALATAGYDYLIMFAEQSTWVMRGDPGFGGQLYELSPTVGCVGCAAWCEGETTELYFLGKEGLYHMPPDAGLPRALSPTRLPRELRGTDRDNFHTTLAYDPEDHGVLIFVVPQNGTGGSHYWFDIETDSFWPITLGRNDHQPVDALTFAGSPVRPRRIVLACFDGFIREWVGLDDDGTPINTHVICGPYPLSENRDIDGILTELVSTTDEQSGDVNIDVFVGRSPEQATALAEAGLNPAWQVTAQGGRDWNFRPRQRGHAFCVRLSSSQVWAFEGLFAKLSVAGKTRR